MLLHITGKVAILKILMHICIADTRNGEDKWNQECTLPETFSDLYRNCRIADCCDGRSWEFSVQENFYGWEIGRVRLLLSVGEDIILNLQKDSIYWMGKEDVIFSVKTCSNLLMKKMNRDENDWPGKII